MFRFLKITTNKCRQRSISERRTYQFSSCRPWRWNYRTTAANLRLVLNLPADVWNCLIPFKCRLSTVIWPINNPRTLHSFESTHIAWNCERKPKARWQPVSAPQAESNFCYKELQLGLLSYITGLRIRYINSLNRASYTLYESVSVLFLLHSHFLEYFPVSLYWTYLWFVLKTAFRCVFIIIYFSACWICTGLSWFFR